MFVLVMQKLHPKAKSSSFQLVKRAVMICKMFHCHHLMIPISPVMFPDDVKETSFPKLKRRVQEELTLHRRRGHVPFDSRCVHCVNTRSVVRHARGVDERQNLGPSAYLVQADFFFLGEPGHKDKFLALSEARLV